MITKSKQDWAIGNVVRVGFLRFKVLAARETPGDGMPDAYLLMSVKDSTIYNRGGKLYQFIPHLGIESIMLDDARELYQLCKFVPGDMETDRQFQNAIPCWMGQTFVGE